MTVRYTVLCGQDTMRQPCLHFVGDSAPLLVPFVREGVNAELANLYTNLHLLVGAAARGELRGNIDIWQNAIRLRRLLFGDDSLGARFPFKPSLLLDVDGYCATIPWELVSDRYVACADPGHRWATALGEHTEGWDVCPQHHPVHVSQGPLALVKHVGVRHLQWAIPDHSQRQSGHVPTQVLLLGDPRDNLGETQHLDRLYQELETVGYKVRLSLGSFATRASLLEALENPTYAAIYIFAHSQRAQEDKPPHIELYNNEFLCARDLPTRFSGRPFIFLNGCWTAKEEWPETSGTTDSLASEFLRRGALAVVGALCKVPAAQAAQAALIFFQEALLASTLGHALARVRMDSYKRYCQGTADLSWFAYRLYGDPDRCLATSVWNDDGTLQQEAFSIAPTQRERHMDVFWKRRRASGLFRADVVDNPRQNSVYTSGDLRRPGRISVSLQRSTQGLSRVGGYILSLRGMAARRADAYRLRSASLPPSVQDVLARFVVEAVTHPGAPGTVTRLPFVLSRVMPLALRRGWSSVPRWCVTHLLQAAQAYELGTASEGLMEQSRADWRHALSPLLQVCHERLHKEALGVGLEGQALETVRGLLGALRALPDRMTPGAAIVMQQTRRNSLLGGSHAHPQQAVLAAFLHHPLIGSPWVLYSQTDRVEYLRDRLIGLRGNPNRAQNIDIFVAELLACARSIAGEEGWVDEYTLFQALCELTGWRIGPSDFLDVYSVPNARGGHGFEEVGVEYQALEKVQELLGALRVLPDYMTPGAAIVMQQTRRNSLLGGSHAHPQQAVLAAFLHHPLIGSPWVLYSQTDRVEYLRDQLIGLRGNADRTYNIDRFVTELLACARSIAGEERWVDEYTLFQALCELTGWRIGVYV